MVNPRNTITTRYGYQERPGRRYTPEERARMTRDVVAAYQAGWGLRAAAALAGCGYSTARTMLAEAGVQARTSRRPVSGRAPGEIIDASPEQRDAIRKEIHSE